MKWALARKLYLVNQIVQYQSIYIAVNLKSVNTLYVVNQMISKLS